VGLSIGKSGAYIAALLGTWSVGAAFVPLDPGLPPVRRRWMIGDVAPRLLMDADAVEALRTEGAPARAPHVAATSDTAYILYTSGTTGRPKGVIVPHRGLLNLFEQQIEAFALDASSRAILFVSTAFDASLSDVGTTLLAGATLVIPERSDVADATALASTLERRRITHADLPPSILRRLDPERPASALSTVVIGGEPCDPAVARRWAANVRLVNVYGPTEATICTSLCVCDPVRWSRPLLGVPLDGIVYRVMADDRDVAAG